MSSQYMEWAKLHSHARYNLATSGLSNYPNELFPSLNAPIELTTKGSYGHEPLLRAIAAKEGVEPENVVTTLGTSMANHLVMAALLRPGDEVVIEDPVYELLSATAGFFEVTIRKCPRHFESEWKLDLAELRKAVSLKTRLIVLSNLHNPTSVYTSEDVLREVGSIAASAGARVLVDEVYLDAMFESQHRSAVRLGGEFIVTNSLTKVYGLSGLRCGWILADSEFAKTLWHMSDLFYANAAYPAEQMSVLAFANLGTIMARTRKILMEHHAILGEFLDSRNDLSVVRPGVGTVVFPKLQNGSVDELCMLLRDTYETSVVPGSFFGMPRHFRIGIGCDRETLEGGLSRLGRALDELKS